MPFVLALSLLVFTTEWYNKIGVVWGRDSLYNDGQLAGNSVFYTPYVTIMLLDNDQGPPL